MLFEIIYLEYQLNNMWFLLVGKPNWYSTFKYECRYHGKGQRFVLASRRDPALVNKASDFLKDHYLVPPFWRQDENKGMVRNMEGRWIQLERPRIEDHPTDIHHLLKKIGPSTTYQWNSTSTSYLEKSVDWKTIVGKDYNPMCWEPKADAVNTNICMYCESIIVDLIVLCYSIKFVYFFICGGPSHQHKVDRLNGGSLERHWSTIISTRCGPHDWTIKFS